MRIIFGTNASDQVLAVFSRSSRKNGVQSETSRSLSKRGAPYSCKNEIAILSEFLLQFSTTYTIL